MAITTTEMRDAYSRIFFTVLRQSNILVNLCDRRWQADVIRNETTYIPTSENAPSIGDYTHGTKWSDASDDTNVSYVEFRLTKNRELTSKVDKRQQRNMSYSVVTQLAEDIGEAVALELDQYVWETVSGATLASGHHVGEFGSATEYLDTDGDPAGTGADDNSLEELVWKPLRRLRLEANERNLTGKSARSQGRMFIVHSPVFGDALAEFLRKDGGADMLAYEQVTGRGLQNGYRGTIFGQFDLYETNSAETKEYSSKDHHLLWMGRADSVAYAETMPQLDYWPPERSPFGPFHQFNGQFEYGAVIPNNTRMLTAAVRAEA